MTQRLKDIQNFLLDMDGTLYLGNRLFEGTLPFLEAVRSRGKRFLFLTNNSSRSIPEYREKLLGMGIPAEPEDLFSSTTATILYLQRQKPGARLYLLATPNVTQEFVQAGFTATEVDPDFVVLTFDKTLTYAKLETASRFLLQGVPFIATHPDFVCPTEDLPIPDCGAMIELFNAATGVRPKVIGKPHREMVESALARLGAGAETTAIVGDRLYTDMAMGFDSGLTTILVLSGETTREMVDLADRRPDYVLESVSELIDRV